MTSQLRESSAEKVEIACGLRIKTVLLNHQARLLPC